MKSTCQNQRKKMHVHPRKHARATLQQILRHSNHCCPSCNLSSAQETARIHTSPWRSLRCVVTQASFDHPPWCGPHPVCLWQQRCPFTLVAGLLFEAGETKEISKLKETSINLKYSLLLNYSYIWSGFKNLLLQSLVNQHFSQTFECLFSKKKRGKHSPCFDHGIFRYVFLSSNETDQFDDMVWILNITYQTMDFFRSQIPSGFFGLQKQLCPPALRIRCFKGALCP